MAQNVLIAGALFPDVPSISVPDQSNNWHSYVDTSDADATASDVAQGKTAYVNGVKITGTGSGGGGGGASVTTETIDPVSGGTILEITTVDISNDTVDASHLVHGYTAHNSSGTAVTGTLTGVSIPQGWGLYNGYLLPEVKDLGDGYDYWWIRANASTGNFDLVRGKSQWYVVSNSGLNAWSIAFANNTTLGSHQYSIPMDANQQSTPASDWGEVTVSYAATYGTGNNRKPIFTNEDIMIQGQSNICLRHGFAIVPNL